MYSYENYVERFGSTIIILKTKILIRIISMHSTIDSFFSNYGKFKLYFYIIFN